MQHVGVKFCGLTRPEDVESALRLGANFLGFIVECKSPRRLSVERATRLSAPAKSLAKRVVVTVNPNDALCEKIRAQIDPDFIQLHGEETPDRAKEIKRATGMAVIKALRIHSKDDVVAAKAYEGIADYLLLDAKPPKNTKQRGGHGVNFDWNLVKDHDLKTPIIIAGGLDSKTIATAKTKTKALFFDVSSGIEVSPGIKDAKLMAQFIKAARNE